MRLEAYRKFIRIGGGAFPDRSGNTIQAMEIKRFFTFFRECIGSLYRG